MTEFMRHKGCLGGLFHMKNEAVWGNMRRVCEILPVAGKPGSFLEYDRLDLDDWEFLCTFFFTATDSLDEETGVVLPLGEGKSYSPSKIATFHGVDFFAQILVPAMEANREEFQRKQAEMKQKLKAAGALEEEPEEPEETEETEPVAAIPLARRKTRQHTA
jgi:hypothetical protein